MIIEVAAIGGAAASITACVAIIKFWMDRGKAEAKAEAAQTSAVVASGKCDLIASALADFKVEVAREYATNRALESALNGIRHEMHGINERLDKFLQAMIGDRA